MIYIRKTPAEFMKLRVIILLLKISALNLSTANFFCRYIKYEKDIL